MPVDEATLTGLIGPVAFLLVLVLLAAFGENTERGRRMTDRAIAWITRRRDG